MRVDFQSVDSCRFRAENQLPEMALPVVYTNFEDMGNLLIFRVLDFEGEGEGIKPD